MLSEPGSFLDDIVSWFLFFVNVIAEILIGQNSKRIQKSCPERVSH